MFSYVTDILHSLENNKKIVSTDTAIAHLRELSLDDFGEVLLEMPMRKYPKLSSFLPKMAEDQVQQNWTGASGMILLRQSLNFIRMMHYRSYEHLGSGLEGKTILDYGCGYGRLLRLMSYFADSKNLIGCDPWDESIRLCQEAGINCRLDVTDYLPESLPYKENSIDFAYAFSVFTHTSMRASIAALKALHKVVKKDGILAITIRPVEYWAFHAGLSRTEQKNLMRDHYDKGYAFKPHNREEIDGDITYGDTSMPFNKIEEMSPEWKIVGYDHSLDDPYQILVFLQSR